MTQPPEIATTWIRLMKQGDERAADAIWDECYPEIQRYAKRKLGGMDPTEVNDVVQSAFGSFFVRARGGRFRKLQESKDLWKLLYTIAKCKAAKRARKKGRLITSSDEAVIELEDTIDNLGGAIDECLECLDDPVLERVFLKLIEGYNLREISEELNCSAESIRLKRLAIRKRLEWFRDKS